MSDAADSEAPAVGATPGDVVPAARAAGPLVVYCGGCNPHIDRGAVVSELEPAPTFVRPGAVVYLSGCPRACASDHQLSRDDPATVIVAGAHVDGVPTPAQDIAAAVTRKLKE